MIIRLLFLLSLGLSGLSVADSNVVRHYQVQERYAYGAQLLELALEKVNNPYRIISPQDQTMNEARGEREVIAGNLDLQWMSTTPERESKLIPIKIPIYRGVLGLRLLLIQSTRNEEFSQIGSLAQLRNYTGAHGAHWGDLPIYAANDLRVATAVQYERLFMLLKKGRVDYFHRGLNEIWAEHQAHQSDLSIADNVMLYYPLPVYFFVTKSRPLLAERIETGLNKALEDGSFEKHFLEYHQSFIDQGDLASRTLIVLENPDLPADTPSLDRSWWLTSTN